MILLFFIILSKNVKNPPGKMDNIIIPQSTEELLREK